MAYDYIRERTTAIGTGGLLKRIWYAMTGATQGLELMSIDDAGKFKCASEQITGLAGAGSRMVVADSSGNLSANLADYTINLSVSTTPVSTGININGYTNGKTILLYFSTAWSDGNATASGIYMIRCGYDGNNYTLVNIAQNGFYAPTFSQVSGVLYVSFPIVAGSAIRATANK